jgi:uncharacterized protein YndB with AHSA1/START domain
MTRKKADQPAVRLERVIPAPPHEVYRAWLEPALLRQWMAPGFDVSRAEVDARVGGHFRIWHADHGVERGGFECEILELVPDERLVFRWGFVGPERTAGPVYDSLLTITLQAAKGDATTLVLLHERLDDLAAAMSGIVDQVNTGWTMVLEKLALLLEIDRRRANASGKNV